MASTSLLTSTSVEGKPQRWQMPLLCSVGMIAVVGLAASTTPTASTELLSSTLPATRQGFAPRPVDRQIQQPSFVVGGNDAWNQRMKTQLNSAPIREHHAGDYTFIYHDNGRVTMRAPPQSPFTVAAKAISGWTSAVQAMFGATIALAAVFAVKLASTCTPPRNAAKQISREIKPIGMKRHRDGIIFQYPEQMVAPVNWRRELASPPAFEPKVIPADTKEPSVSESPMVLSPPTPTPVAEAPKAPPVVWDGALRTSMEWDRHVLQQRQARINELLPPPVAETPPVAWDGALRTSMEWDRHTIEKRQADIDGLLTVWAAAEERAVRLEQEREEVLRLTMQITTEREHLVQRQKEIGRLRHRQEVDAAVAVQQAMEEERQQKWQQVVEAERQEMEAKLAERRMALEKEAQAIQAMKQRLEEQRRELAFTDIRVARELAILQAAPSVATTPVSVNSVGGLQEKHTNEDMDVIMPNLGPFTPVAEPKGVEGKQLVASK